MPSQKFIAIPSIKINGLDISKEMMDDLLEFEVETSLYLPSMFTVKLHDSQLKWIDDSNLDIGKQLEISIRLSEGQGSITGVLIKGEITALEPYFSVEGETALLVRGYDKAHRLHRGKKTRTFKNVTDSDLVKKIAGETGLSTELDETSITYPYVLQNNQTNMEFLHTRAARIGYQVYAAEGKLYFKKGDANLGEAPELKFAENLVSFQPRWTAAHQSDKMVVNSWDPKKKEAIVGQATPPSSLTQGGVGSTGGDKAKSAFGGPAEATVVARPVFTRNEADALALGLSQDIAREAIQADGVCAGDPRVQAGRKIKISKVGTRFSGTYFITAAVHHYDANGYETRFNISGRQPNTLSHLLESDAIEEQGLVLGVVVGIVTNNTDPDDLGRIKVKYPWLGKWQGADIESDWVRLASPMAGSDRGFLYFPEVNDEVLIAFEHGDMHRPYVVGALWSSTDKPPRKNSEAVGDGKVNQRLIKTRAGHVVMLDDKQGEEQVSITSKSGHTVILDDKSGSESITIQDKTKNNKLVIDSTKNSMTINVNGDFVVEAKGKVSIKSTQDMSLQATTKVSVKGTTGLSLDGSTQAELKGAQVSVSGSGMTEVKGGIVKIN